MKRLIWIVLLMCDVFFTGVVYSQSVNTELSDNLLRLHIIANSNSQADTSIKYSVRDKINTIISDYSFSDSDKVIKKLIDIEDKVNEYLSETNADYGCKIIYTTADFPTKKYNNIIMPAGKYKCIKAVLGDGEGENWWCIAYPPLCFTEAVCGDISTDGEERLKSELSTDTYEIIRSDKVSVRFLTVDLINKLIAAVRKE